MALMVLSSSFVPGSMAYTSAGAAASGAVPGIGASSVGYWIDMPVAGSRFHVMACSPKNLRPGPFAVVRKVRRAVVTFSGVAFAIL